MRTQTTILLVMAMSFLGCTSRVEKPKIYKSLKDYNLIGKVKSVSERSYRAIKYYGKIKRGEFVSGEKLFFNENGKITIDYYYFANSSIGTSKYVYKYNDDGSLRSEDFYNNEKLNTHTN